MRKARCAAMALMLAGFVSSPATATITAHDILAKIDAGREADVGLLVGASAGFMAANAWLASKNRPVMFCVPNKLAVTPDQTVRILRDYLAYHPSSNSIDVSTVLLGAFEYTFPCTSKLQ